MHVVVRGRVLLAKHRWVYWAAVSALAVAVGLGVEQRFASLEAERSTWNETRSILVATTDLEPDGPISVEHRTLPLAAIAPTALDSIPDGARLHQRVSAGEAIVAADLVARTGPARHADVGTVVVGIIDALSPSPSIGLRVHVSSEGVLVATDATIVDVVEDVIYVAVDERDGPVTASAAQSGFVSLIFLP